MKSLVVLALSLVSINALAQDLNCSGAIERRGEPAHVHITLNDKDGLIVADAADNGRSSSSVTIEPSRVQHWKEGIVPVVGYAPGIKIYLLSAEHASLRRLEGWGTGNPNGDFADLQCE